MIVIKALSCNLLCAVCSVPCAWARICNPHFCDHINYPACEYKVPLDCQFTKHKEEEVVSTTRLISAMYEL